MNKFKPTYTEVTDWNYLVYQNTTGSRSKKIIVDPLTSDEYFLKGSKELSNGTIKFPTEFWSEIVSSKIGQFLGFNVLDYNIGYNEEGNQKIGCLSKSMVSNSINKLTERKVYLSGYDSSYNPEEDKEKYTFQFIRSTLNDFEFDEYINALFEIIIFDSIIGNSDRHQENWGIITNFEETIEAIDNELNNPHNKRIKRWSLRFRKFIMNALVHKFKSENFKVRKGELQTESIMMRTQFSPIYDSGCCLGRELLDEKVDKMLSNPQMIEAYVNKGKSEIHWEGKNKKQNHFDLINLLKDKYNNEIHQLVSKVKMNYNAEKVKDIIYQIDANLPENLSNYKLPENRKELMIKLITLRIQKLLDLL